MTAADLPILAEILIIYTMMVMSPGPNFIVVTRYALGDTVRAAFTATIGLAIAATINASMTIYGAGALIVHYPWFRVVIAIVGGLALTSLGILTIYGLTRRIRAKLVSNDFGVQPVDEPQSAVSDVSLVGSFMKGFWVNLLHPKGIAFFLGVYAPLMTIAGMPLKLTVLVICFGIELVWYSIVILLFSHPKIRALYACSATLFDMLIGAILVFLGLRIMCDMFIYL